MEKTGKLRVSMCEFTTIMECHKYNGYLYYQGVPCQNARHFPNLPKHQNSVSSVRTHECHNIFHNHINIHLIRT
jgi:hypothetical protein